MAEPAKGGGGSGGGGFGGGAGGMIFFMFVIATGLYVVATQPGIFGMPGGKSINFGSLFGGGSNASGRTDIPAGFTASQLSPLFKKVRVVSIAPPHGSEPGVLGLAALPDAPAGLTLAGWYIEGKSGRQNIGAGGAGAGSNWKIPLKDLNLNPNSDRVRVFDERGLLVDEYSY
ncbi:MAG TPA: hypothetical protein VMC43_00800 [Candidatus Paceibacterota bacterium]|nr:hypothetical protein [Candidatus Paceibacterota bacterium]